MLETQHRWIKVADRQARRQGNRPWTAASLALTPHPAVRLGRASGSRMKPARRACSGTA